MTPQLITRSTAVLTAVLAAVLATTAAASSASSAYRLFAISGDNFSFYASS
jgi:hypothetical protein